MRELKFKCWDEKEKVWCDIGNGSLCDISYAAENGDICFMDDYIYPQYTGLKDKAGKEICEGDIVMVKIKNEILYCEVQYSPNRACYVFKRNKHYISYMSLDDIFTEILVDNIDSENSYIELEVVGNIYENPDLLCL